MALRRPTIARYISCLLDTAAGQAHCRGLQTTAPSPSSNDGSLKYKPFTSQYAPKGPSKFNASPKAPLQTTDSSRSDYPLTKTQKRRARQKGKILADRAKERETGPGKAAAATAEPDQTAPTKGSLSKPPTRKRFDVNAFYRNLRPTMLPVSNNERFQQNLRIQRVNQVADDSRNSDSGAAFRRPRSENAPSRIISQDGKWSPSKPSSRTSKKLRPSLSSRGSTISEDNDWSQTKPSSRGGIKRLKLTTTPQRPTPPPTNPTLPQPLLNAIVEDLTPLLVYPYRAGTPAEAHHYLQQRDKHYLRRTEAAMSAYISGLKSLRSELETWAHPIPVMPKSNPQWTFVLDGGDALRSPVEGIMPEIESKIKEVSEAREYVRDLLVMAYEGVEREEVWEAEVQKMGRVERERELGEIRNRQAASEGRLKATTDELLRTRPPGWKPRRSR